MQLFVVFTLLMMISVGDFSCVTFNSQDSCCKNNPCVNYGKCIPVEISIQSFKCSCESGTYGQFCQVKAKSCQDVLNAEPKATSGIYYVQDQNDNLFPVYCFMDEEMQRGWTLVTSFTLANKDQFGKGFMVDLPVQEDTPNFSSYRVSYLMMVGLNSEMWMATCAYDVNKNVRDRDFMMAKFSNADLFNTLTGGVCEKLSVVNLRGILCSNCTAAISRSSTTATCLSVNYSKVNCQFRVNHNDFEQVFGHYIDIKNTKCTESSQATTQWWFG